MTDKNEENYFHFSRDKRLLSADHYKNVFAKAQRFGNHSFTLLVRKNELAHPRLGMAISKKNAKRAVDRNRIKRIFRESFRNNQHNLPCVDIIAMSKPSALKLDNREMREQIDRQWHFIRKKFPNADTAETSS